MISKRTIKLINYMPKTFVRWAARIIVNRYLNEYAKITVINKERLNKKTPSIFVCNHLSNADGLILNKVLKDHGVWFVAGVKLADNDLTSIGLDVVKIIPINPSSADKGAIAKIITLLKSGESILIFPEGTRSRKASMIEAKKGILLIARLAKVPIVPIGIVGTEKLMPINDNDMGEEKFHHADVKVTIGESFNVDAKEKGEEKEDYENRALNSIMRRIAELLPEDYRGIYK